MSELIRILYVDDNLLDRELVRDVLEKEHGGFLVIEAKSRVDFEMRLAEGGYDLVLSDFNILGFEGLQVIEAVHAKKPGIPVVLVTGTGSEEIAVEAMKRGAFDYVIKKPTHIRRLPYTIHAALEKKRLNEEYKKTETALRESEEIFSAAFCSSPIPLCISTFEGKFIKVNRMFCDLVGYSQQEIIGKTASELGLLSAQDCETLVAAIENAGGSLSNVELKFRVRDGSFRHILYSMTPISLHGIPHRLSTNLDVTERKHAEWEQEKLKEQLFHIQKVESVGRLAGGIAHDFNNILMVIVGFANLLLSSIKDDDTSRDYIHKILKSSERAANLTKSLLTFSRRQPHNPEPVNLNDIVKEVEHLVSRIIKEDIKVTSELTGKDCIVMADSGQIEQVLMNLATNARDAMPGGGLLCINTDIVEMDGAFIKAHGYGVRGRYAMISVSDSGIGMDKQTQEKIFEPFFTTKEVGKGTGLGLSIVYGIVKQHGGYINVYSEPGRGATFRIYLPLIQTELEKAKLEAHAFPRGGTETILIAEDDTDVRNLLEMMLVDHGYKAIVAIDGVDAIQKFKENKDNVQLLLLDGIMPKKNGKEVYDEIRKMFPDIKSIFISGYGNDIAQEKNISIEKLSFISKPVLPTELLRKIREILDR